MSTHNITLVTGLWNIKRDELTEGWSRSFEEHYIVKFKQLLDVPCNLIIFGEESLRDVVFEKRTKDNTLFVPRDQSWFKNEFYNKIQEIRQKPEWYNQAGWLKESTQSRLEMYNPLVMSKPFLLNDAKIFDPFNSSHLFWIDAGLTTTVHPGYFTHDKVLDKLSNLIHNLTFVAFPYNASTEIHGFSYPEINTFATQDVKLVCRGGFFGGPKESISEFNTTYYSALQDTLNSGYMGTEESVFSILLYKYPELFSYAEIQDNGLISTFFENIKNGKLKIENKSTVANKSPLNFKKVGLYVITYNSPSQFEKLCQSFELYDKNYLDLPQKFLLNNSLDKSTDEKYFELCEKYGFTEIKKDNIGICGGRQFIAEHFNEQSNLDYCLFFEDDMFFYGGERETCKNGFQRKVSDIYKKSLEITHRENFDFLKLNFTEFYGDNHKQWAWHNLPADKRKELFPEKPVKVGNDVNQAPFMKIENIKSLKGVPYASGEVYYCNWPQIVSKEGNQKMFLDIKWEYPYEQTWMSYIFQQTVIGDIKPGILLCTPTEHDRFDFYPKEERREN